MADLSTLARPYAKAAFDFARQHDVVNQWQNYLAVMNAIVKDETFSNYLHNPAINADNKVAALVDIYNHSNNAAIDSDSNVFKTILVALDNSQEIPANGHLSTQFTNYLTQLAQQDRLALLPSIYDNFTLLKASDVKEVHAYIRSAYPLTSDQTLLLESRLANSVGSSIITHIEVDPSLMAGVTIKIGDKLIDDSVRGKLKQLKTQLIA